MALDTKTVYGRMASSPVKISRVYSVGEFPQRRWIARFEHENGLIVEHDGQKWEVKQKER